jgi:serine/threonine protein kinase
LSDIFSDDVLASIDGAIEQSMSVRTFAVADIIGERFKVERVVGRGNFGFVYRVKDVQTGKTRALKTFYEKFSTRDGAGQALVDLGNVLAQITHPNLVRVFETGRDGDLVFFLEEFVSAMTLARLVTAVRKNAPEQGFPPDEMAGLIRSVCGLLGEFTDITHGGLNPQNIFMSKQGVKVSDLGVVTALRPYLTNNDFKVMTASRFWAPEMIRAGALGQSIDVYSLGRLLEYLLSLGETAPPGEPTPIKGQHEPGLAQLVSATAATDIDERPPNVAAFAGAFEAGLQGATVVIETKHEDSFPAEEDDLAAAVESAADALTERVWLEEATGELPEVEPESIGKQIAEPVTEQIAEPVTEPVAEETSLGDFAAEAQFFEEEPAAPPTQEELPLPEAEPEPEPAAEEPPAPVEDFAADERVAPKPEREPAKPRSLWPYAAIFALVLVGAFFLLKDRIIVPLPPAPDATPEVAIDQNNFDLEGITIKPEPGGPTLEEMLEALVVQADTYMKANRITDPPEDSAFGLYTFVLDIDPDNKPAKQGVKDVEDYYLKYGRAFMTSKKYSKAEWMFNKVLFVDDANTEAKQALAKIAKLNADTVVATGPPPTSPPTKPPTTPPAPGATPQPIAPPQPTPPPQPLGKITATTIKSTIAKYMGRVKFCFAKSPDAKGTVKVSFVINPSGTVSGAHVASTNMGNAAIEQCLVRRVSVMKFPTFAGAPKNVTFPFRFNE